METRTAVIGGKQIKYYFHRSVLDRKNMMMGVLSYDPEIRRILRSYYKNALYATARRDGYDWVRDVNARDTVYIDVQEGWRTSVTYKTFVLILVASEIPALTYLVKIDDDAIAYPVRLEKKLIASSPDYFGSVNTKFRPVRDLSNIYHVTTESYPYPEYPDFCCGAGYAISKRALLAIKPFMATTPYMPMEDVAVGILMQKAGIKPINTDLIMATVDKKRSPFMAKTITYIQHGMKTSAEIKPYITYANSKLWYVGLVILFFLWLSIFKFLSL